MAASSSPTTKEVDLAGPLNRIQYDREFLLGLRGHLLSLREHPSLHNVEYASLRRAPAKMVLVIPIWTDQAEESKKRMEAVFS